MKTLKDYIAEAKGQIEEVTLQQANELLASGIKVLDVREPNEFLTGALPGAINIPRGLLEPAADLTFSGAKPELRDHRHDAWLVVCKSGERAALATQTLQEMGFTQVKNLLGGTDAWQAADLPITVPYRGKYKI